MIKTPSDDTNNPLHLCPKCGKDFPDKLSLGGHTAGKHRENRCRECNVIFESKGKLGFHKIEAHGFTRKQLGWGLIGGWNRGMTQLEAFNVTGSKVRHGNADFMNRLNTPEYLAKKRRTRNYHETVVLRKESELRARGYRTFCTSNYAHHNRIPDIIAISPAGKVVAVELESKRPYKSSFDSLRKRYTILLMKENFFDDVIVEEFTIPKFATEDSNRISDETS